MQKLIIDGFPRVLTQGLIYESKVTEVYLIVLFNVAREVLFDRMMKRVADTPVEKRRSDDKPEVLENRINTFMSETMKACDFYNKLGKVRVIEAQADPDTVEPFHPGFQIDRGGFDSFLGVRCRGGLQREDNSCTENPDAHALRVHRLCVVLQVSKPSNL